MANGDKMQLATMKNIVKEKLNIPATADSQKETIVTATPVIEKPKEEENQMSAYKQFLVKDIEETKERQKKNKEVQEESKFMQ